MGGRLASILVLEVMLVGAGMPAELLPTGRAAWTLCCMCSLQVAQFTQTATCKSLGEKSTSPIRGLDAAALVLVLQAPKDSLRKAVVEGPAPQIVHSLRDALHACLH